jgi:hypothetical protein
LPESPGIQTRSSIPSAKTNDFKHLAKVLFRKTYREERRGAPTGARLEYK